MMEYKRSKTTQGNYSIELEYVMNYVNDVAKLAKYVKSNELSREQGSYAQKLLLMAYASALQKNAKANPQMKEAYEGAFKKLSSLYQKMSSAGERGDNKEYSFPVSDIGAVVGSKEQMINARNNGAGGIEYLM